MLKAKSSLVSGANQVARVSSCPRRKPLSRRLNDFINSQASNPRGLFAYLLAAIWRRDHVAINSAALDLLEISPGMRVIDLGCGPGEALGEIARRGAFALGLDVSQRMVAIARRRNAAAGAAGRIDVRRVQGGTLDLAANAFDGALSVHCLYFWPAPADTLAQLAAALKSGGRLVLAFMPDGSHVPARLRGPSYRFYAPEAVERLLAGAGFANVRTMRRADIPDVVLVVGDKT